MPKFSSRLELKRQGSDFIRLHSHVSRDSSFESVEENSWATATRYDDVVGERRSRFGE